MAIIKTVTSESEFYHWLKQSDSYKNSFSYEGANAVQQWIEEYSVDSGEDVEFDPIAWCCEFSEYESIEDAYRQHYGDDSDLPVEQRRTTAEQQLEYFEDNTIVIELNNGGVVIRDF